MQVQFGGDNYPFEGKSIPQYFENMAEPLRIAIGSTNPVKISASLDGISASFRCPPPALEGEGFDVSSEVPDQPTGDDETKRGALNRAKNAFESFKAKHGMYPNFSVGLEGGILISMSDSTTAVMECFAWICVFNGSKFGTAKTASFLLPSKICELVRQ